MTETTQSTIPSFAAAAERDSVTTWEPGDLAYAADYGWAYWDGTAWQRVAAGYMAPLHRVENAAQTCAGTANVNTYASLPTPLVGTVTYDGAHDVLTLAVLSAYLDISANNGEVAVALDIAGTVNSPAGSVAENRLHVVAKQPVGVGLTETTYAVLGAGSSTVEVKYAGSACTISDVTFTLVPLAVVPPGTAAVLP